MNRTISRRLSLVTVAMLGGALAGPFLAGPALAAPTTSDRFPQIVPAWYSTASEVQYTANAAPAPSEWVDKTSNQDFSYWLPQGGYPGDNSVDIEITNLTPTDNPIAAKFDLSDSPQLQSDLGTKFTDGFVLTGSKTTMPADDVIFDGQGGFQISRPIIPANCSAPDPQQYSLLLAMLGQNQVKYLVSVDVYFGDRSKERAKHCDPAPAKDAISKSGTSADASAATPVQQQMHTSTVSSQGYNWLPVLAVLAAIATVVFLIWRFKLLSRLKRMTRSRPSTPFNDDGTMRSGGSIDEALASPGGKPATRTVMELVFGKKRNTRAGSGFDLDD